MIVYVVEVYYELFGYFRLYPHLQVICADYQHAKKTVVMQERLLKKHGYKCISTEEEIRAEEPQFDVYLENHWCKLFPVSKTVILDTFYAT